MGEKEPKSTVANLERLKKTVEEGRYYEALQQYKALFFRFSVRKPEEATEIVQNGACVLLRHGKGEEGLELSLLFIKSLGVLKEDGVPSEHLESIEHLSDAFSECGRQASTHSTVDDRARARHIRFMSAAVRWSHPPKSRCGHPRLHQILGQLYKSAGERARALAHLARGGDGAGLVETLPAWADGPHPAGLPPLPLAERELLLARAVVQCLGAGQDGAAGEVARGLAVWAGGDRGGATGLGNMAELLVRACRRREPRLFHLLRREYGAGLARDGRLGEELGWVGHRYFGLPPPPKTGGLPGLLGALLSPPA